MVWAWMNFLMRIKYENPELSLRNGAIAGWDEKNYLYFSMLDSLAAHFSIDIDQSYYKLPQHFRKILFYGTDENIEFKLVKLNKKTKNLSIVLKFDHGKVYVIFLNEIIIMHLDLV